MCRHATLPNRGRRMLGEKKCDFGGGGQCSRILRSRRIFWVSVVMCVVWTLSFLAARHGGGSHLHRMGICCPGEVVGVRSKDIPPTVATTVKTAALAKTTRTGKAKTHLFQHFIRSAVGGPHETRKRKTTNNSCGVEECVSRNGLLIDFLADPFEGKRFKNKTLAGPLIKSRRGTTIAFAAPSSLGPVLLKASVIGALKVAASINRCESLLGGTRSGVWSTAPASPLTLSLCGVFGAFGIANAARARLRALGSWCN